MEYSRYKDRALRGRVDSETCMDSATASCSRRSPGAKGLLVEALLDRVMVPEGWEMLMLAGLFSSVRRLCALRPLGYKCSNIG